MKIRKGFVSNSSSSSFICDITGGTESGWDACLSDVEMCECENGHTFFTDGYPEIEKLLSGEYEDEDGEDVEGDRYSIPAKLCPICNGDLKTKKIIVQRLQEEMKHLNITLEDLKNG
jgi:hypothetical protein